MHQEYIPIGGKYTGADNVLTLLNVSRSTFQRLRQRCPDFPKPVIYSRSCIRFKRAEIVEWMESKKGAAE